MGLGFDWRLVVSAALAFVIVFVAIFVYKLVSVSIRNQIKAEQERGTAIKQLTASDKEKPVEHSPAISDRVKLVQKLFLDKADESQSVETTWDNAAWMEGAGSLVRGAVTPSFGKQFRARYAIGGSILTPRDRQQLAHAASTLRAMAAKLRDEHLLKD